MDTPNELYEFYRSKLDKVESTCSKLLTHNWYAYQTEIASNIIFESAKFANAYFKKMLSKHHTIRLTE